MRPSVKVFNNTLVLYLKIVVSTIVGLYLTRVVLDVLGIEDFGIYNLIAGIIALLAFVESSLMSSTQRYLSLAIGQDDVIREKKYFSAGLLIHLAIGFLITAILEIIGLFLFDGFLNIPSERIAVAKEVYQLMILSTFFTVIGIPYNAAINANEDIWFYGLVQIICNVLKLGLIFAFKYINVDALWLYTAWVVAVTIIGVFVSILWCRSKYNSTRNLDYSFSNNKQDIGEMLGFSSWNTLGAFAVVCRNQGTSVALNVFFGPAINGVFGIANQVDGQLISFANTLTSSMTPQIVKSQGQGDQERLRILSVFASKTAFMLSALFALPLMLELPLVLDVWLKEVPPYAELYCRLILILFLICEFYPGLSRGIQAVGQIKWQQIWSSVCVVMPIPLGIVLFKFGFTHYTIVYLMLIAQIASLMVSVHWSRKLYQLNVVVFSIYILKALLLFGCIFFFCRYFDVFLMSSMSNVIRFITISIISSSLFLFLFYKFCLNNKEREMIRNLAKQLLLKRR